MAEVVAFERRYSVRLPEDLRSFLELVDGSDQMDDEGFRFWPLAEIRLVEEELGAFDPDDPDRFSYPGCFVFADYLIWCWAYAIQLIGDPEDVGRVFVLSGDDKRLPPVASSFTEFSERYLRQPEALYPP